MLNEADSKLKNELDDIRKELERIYDIDSSSRNTINIDWSKTKSQNTKNWNFVESLLKRKGWLGISSIGNKANAALYLVVQHQNLADRQRWINELKKSVDKGESSIEHLRMMEDRIQLDIGKSSIYGTQFYANRNSRFYNYKSKFKNNKQMLKFASSLIGESFSKIEIDKIKSINSDIDIKELDSFYSILQDSKLLKLPEDLHLNDDELIKEKVSTIIGKIRNEFKDIKTVDLKLYLEVLISMNNSVKSDTSKQLLITPVSNNNTLNIMSQNENKQYSVMNFNQFLNEKKLEISFDKKNLLKFANLVIDSLFKVDDEVSEDMVRSILFKNKKYEDETLFHRTLDSIEDVEKHPEEFFYCLSIANVHTISNLKSIGELNAREVRFICNEIKAKPELYKIKYEIF